MRVLPLAAGFLLTAVSGAERMEAAQMKNRLSSEKSSYLLQHADNPVDWHPWGEEAFEKARREDKPVFLSIGYSTCHWCHVMERESFEDPETAALLNKNFVPVKVDREERPDVDKVYMTAAIGAGWGSGWPLSVWLTPDLEPFYGGTYFPPEPKPGMPSFRSVLERIAELWKTERKAVLSDADRVAEALRGYAGAAGGRASMDRAWLAQAAEELSSERETAGPLFPLPCDQDFLLRYYAASGEKKALGTALKKLRAMARGGIYDHVGGGFHRYSVDGEWRVPHFEKMLYDNAQLAVGYIEAYQAVQDPELARTAEETLGYMLRDLAHPGGGFYSAEDADSRPADDPKAEKEEGAFYLWTQAELRETLGQAAAEVFAYRYGVQREGNAPADPRGEFRGKNILYAARTVSQTAKKFGRTEGEVERLLKVARGRLLEARSKRPRPHRDEKVLTDWNGLAVSALAKGYQVFEDRAYLEAAQRTVRFIRSELYDEKGRRIYHRWAGGERSVDGMAADYAFLAQGLLDLYEADFDPDRLDWALELAEVLQERFARKGGGYYMTAEGSAPHLIARMTEDSDGVEPAASSVAALVLLRLSHFTGRRELEEAAEKTLERFGGRMRDAPRSLTQMLAALEFATAKPRQIIISGDPEEPATKDMLRAVHARLLPAKILMVAGPKTRERLSRRLRVLKGMAPIDGGPTAYICVNYSCAMPTNDLQKVIELLDKKR